MWSVWLGKRHLNLNAYELTHALYHDCVSDVYINRMCTSRAHDNCCKTIQRVCSRRKVSTQICATDEGINGLVNTATSNGCYVVVK